MPDVIYAQASPRSAGGTSLFDASAAIRGDTVANFFSEDAVTRAATLRLQEAGFRVLQVSPTTINIAGPAEAYERAFSTTLKTVERDVIKPGAREDTATFIDTCPIPRRPSA